MTDEEQMVEKRVRSRSPTRSSEEQVHDGKQQGWKSGGGWQSAYEDDPVPEPWYVDAHDVAFHPSDASGAVDHICTLILLHSCSGGPDDFLPFIHRLNVVFRNRLRIVLPCSPVRKEEHFGWVGTQNSWFQYDDERGNAAKYPAQLLEQRSRILRVLEQERQRFPDGNAQRIILGGLSQGVSLAVDVALHAPCAVGGIIALRGSTVVDSLAGLEPCSADSGREPIVLLAYHGARDNQCNGDDAKAGYEALRPYGVKVIFELDYSLGHACARGRQKLCAAELRRIAAFLKERWGHFVEEANDK